MPTVIRDDFKSKLLAELLMKRYEELFRDCLLNLPARVKLEKHTTRLLLHSVPNSS